MTHSEFRIESGDGTKLALYRDGDGPPLLLVNGSLSDYHYWDRLLPLLTGHFAVYRLERRARGSSDTPATFEPAREADDMAAVLNAIGPATVFGHSSGATLALTAARHPNVRRVIVYDPPLFLPEARRPMTPELPQRLLAFIESGDLDEATAAFLREGPLLGEEELAALRAGPRWSDLVTTGASTPYDAWLALNHGLHTLAELARGVDLRIIQGETSPPWMVAGIHAFAERVRIEPVVLPGHGHAAVFTAPQLLADAIVRLASGE